jgi:DNA-binding winged helix-turn-helix (wHTH) protein
MSTAILTMTESAERTRVLRFGRFCLVPGSRTLLRDGAPVPLGGRAFDLLHVLLRARGSLVSKEEIIVQVWPHVVVEESNLRFQMARLRRALEEDRGLIVTVPGRGYLLVAHPADPEADHRLSRNPILWGDQAEAYIAGSETATQSGALRHLMQSLLGELKRLSSEGEPDGARPGSV